MPRSLEPYIAILEDFLGARIGQAEFRTRSIDQFSRVDFGVNWAKEWGREVADALEQMDGDAEVIYPEAPSESYLSQEQLTRSCARNLRTLRDAWTRRPRGVEGPIAPPQ
jgi:hypothetical protein